MNVLKKPFQNYLHYGMIPVDGNLSIPRSKKNKLWFSSSFIFLEKCQFRAINKITIGSQYSFMKGKSRMTKLIRVSGILYRDDRFSFDICSGATLKALHRGAHIFTHTILNMQSKSLCGPLMQRNLKFQLSFQLCYTL